MNIKTLVVNALVAALYFVVTWLIAPFGFTHIQFRISEFFNHLIVFNKKYFFGIVIGVFMANLLLSPVKIDILFGLTHTIVSLVITMLCSRWITNKFTLMFINSVIFSVNMFIIAYMLKVFAGLEFSFIFIWLTTGIGEFITMIIAIPIIYFLNKRLAFKKLI